jgi:hypothetical protein
MSEQKSEEKILHEAKEEYFSLSEWIFIPDV